MSLRNPKCPHLPGGLSQCCATLLGKELCLASNKEPSTCSFCHRSSKDAYMKRHHLFFSAVIWIDRMISFNPLPSKPSQTISADFGVFFLSFCLGVGRCCLFIYFYLFIIYHTYYIYSYIYINTHIYIYIYTSPSVGGVDTVAPTSFDLSRAFILCVFVCIRVHFFSLHFSNEDMTNFHVMNSKLASLHWSLAQEESPWQAIWDFLALCILRCHRRVLTMLDWFSREQLGCKEVRSC